VKLIATPWTSANLQHSDGNFAEQLRLEHLDKGLPESLVEPLHQAALADVRILVIDADAPTLKGLPLFDASADRVDGSTQEAPAPHEANGIAKRPSSLWSNCANAGPSESVYPAQRLILPTILRTCSLVIPAACPGSRDLQDCGALHRTGRSALPAHAALTTPQGIPSLAGGSPLLQVEESPNGPPSHPHAIALSGRRPRTA
jgi:hypothetical protein